VDRASAAEEDDSADEEAADLAVPWPLAIVV
jgi:hypothetical protein